MSEEAINVKKTDAANLGRLALEIAFLLILALYPMRHVTYGGDLWDIGYNYGNFTYPEIGRVGKMWYFSTYLAEHLGHLLTLLPFGRTWIGLNVYTGLFSSFLAVMGYLFFTRTLKASPILAFAGEMTALSMCWCPTALLYNYLTYALFTGCVILLYHGLKKKKNLMLVLAGACLGTNVFVRFSNLPEMGMILAVWGYVLLSGWEDAKGEDGERSAGWFGRAMGELAGKTGWCLLGYAGALVIGFGWIAVRYGIGEYVSGIRLLFAMTETATDYKPTSMINGLIWPYKEGLIWVARLLFFSVVASVIKIVTDYLPLCVQEEKREKISKIFDLIGMAGVIGVVVFQFWWMFLQRESQPNLTSFYYTSYDPIYWLGTLFMMLAMGIGLIETFRPGNVRENRFLGMAIILLVLLTSLGSNNGIYPGMNHLFLPAPYVLWKLADFTIWCLKAAGKKAKTKTEFRPSLVPLCATVWAFVFVCVMQFFLFGRYFVFCEGTGMKEKGYEITNSDVLKGVQMSQERAAYISDLIGYVNREKLAGREVILHGDMPALSFYLKMPPAFHSWNDLQSFSYDTMQETLDELMKEISEGKREKPVVIARSGYVVYGPLAPGEESKDEEIVDEKWELIRRFMGLYGYKQTFLDGMFVAWEAVEE